VGNKPGKSEKKGEKFRPGEIGERKSWVEPRFRGAGEPIWRGQDSKIVDKKRKHDAPGQGKTGRDVGNSGKERGRKRNCV